MTALLHRPEIRCHPVPAVGRVRLEKPSDGSCLRLFGDIPRHDPAMGLGVRRSNGLLIHTAWLDIVKAAKFLTENYAVEVEVDSDRYYGFIPAASWLHEEIAREHLARI